MPPTPQTDPGFVFRPNPPLESPINFPFPSLPSPLGPLEPLAGAWAGRGFNTIWRPNFPDSPQDRFLELNLTSETLSFTPIPGAIPNRGLLQQDMNMFGLTYMQQIADSSDGSGLHIEPGIWAVVPQTTNPAEQATVVRMASIPHGTVILVQGIASTDAGPPTIPDNNITPFTISGGALVDFPEVDLAQPTTFRSLPQPGITQAMVTNPNSVLNAAIAGQTIRSTTTLRVTTTSTPVLGGGTANTAFLHGGNADATEVDATFWIETVEDPNGGPDTLQLQYSQTVMLDFNTLRWPHITVGTLRKSIPVDIPVPIQVVHPDIPNPAAPASPIVPPGNPPDPVAT